MSIVLLACNQNVEFKKKFMRSTAYWYNWKLCQNGTLAQDLIVVILTI